MVTRGESGRGRSKIGEGDEEVKTTRYNIIIRK